jgi:hypothetical protein
MDSISCSKLPKVALLYNCIFCHYKTSKKSSWNKHLATDKHKKRQNDSEMVVNDSIKVAQYKCTCGKIYKYDSGYYRHKKMCLEVNVPNNEKIKISDETLVNMLITQCKELRDENKELIGIIKNSTHLTTNCNNTNSNNKTFNLNVFLNETCKDAMNINEFVDSIKLQLCDLENVGRIGYVEGISNIIVKNLKALDENKRPIHCADKKRDTMYIKDQNTWEKDGEEKKLRRAIKNIAFKNQRLILKFKEVHPDCGISTSVYSDQYNRLLIECMGGSGDNDIEKEDKIIRKISNATVINKDS